jgi:hypothetical protein
MLRRAWRCALVAALVVGGSAFDHASAQVCGDPSGDRNVTVADGVQVLRAAAGLDSLCATLPAVCDVDGSVATTVADGVNVLRAAAGLPSLRRCPTGVTGVLGGVESDGPPPRLEIGMAPIPAPGAPVTISDIQGSTTVTAGSVNVLTLTYDISAGAAEVAEAGNISLIVAASSSGSFAAGFFELPLEARAGTIEVRVTLAANLGPGEFDLEFSTRSEQVVSQYWAFRQRPTSQLPVCAEDCSGNVCGVNPRAVCGTNPATGDCLCAQTNDASVCTCFQPICGVGDPCTGNSSCPSGFFCVNAACCGEPFCAALCDTPLSELPPATTAAVASCEQGLWQ